MDKVIYNADGSTTVNDTKIRKYKFSEGRRGRAPHVHTEVWTTLSAAEKDKEWARYDDYVKWKKEVDDNNAAAASSSASSSTGLVATKRYNRSFIEFCTSNSSILSSAKCSNDGCYCVRLTEKYNLKTRTAIQYARGEITKASQYGPGIFWGSLPCTAGCSYYEVNQKWLTARIKRELQLMDFDLLIEHWIELACHAAALGFIIAYEWPRANGLWLMTRVIEMIELLQV